jgi:hypothetical protein
MFMPRLQHQSPNLRKQMRKYISYRISSRILEFGEFGAASDQRRAGYRRFSAAHAVFSATRSRMRSAIAKKKASSRSEIL